MCSTPKHPNNQQCIQQVKLTHICAKNLKCQEPMKGHVEMPKPTIKLRLKTKGSVNAHIYVD